MARTTTSQRVAANQGMGGTEIQECHDTCLRTLTYCLEQGGQHAESDHIRAMQDCIDVCRLSTDAMLRGSRFHADIMALCAKVCKACEEDCKQFEGDQTMDDCARACRACADACRRMAK